MPASEFAIAFSGGLVSFLSPCVLPVVPAYLSVTTGLSLTEMTNHSWHSRLVAARGASLFILGFSAVFVALGLSVTALGATLLRSHVPITRICGALVVVLALGMLGSTFERIRMPGRDLRFHPQTARLGVWGAPLAGAAFAFGWTPCIGPVLGSVLAVAARQQAAMEGGLLLAMYAAGLALPLMVTALAFDRSVMAMRWTQQHSRTMTRGAATVLGAYGLVLGGTGFVVAVPVVAGTGLNFGAFFAEAGAGGMVMSLATQMSSPPLSMTVYQISFPSGDQVGLEQFPAVVTFTAGRFPSASTSQTSFFMLARFATAIHFPSGDQVGQTSSSLFSEGRSPES